MARKLSWSASRSTWANVQRITWSSSRRSVTMLEIAEARFLFQKRETNEARGTVALFRDVELRHVLVFRLDVGVLVRPEQQDDEIRVLFQRAGFAQIRQHRTMVRPRLGCAAELRQDHDRHAELFGQLLQRARNG